MDCLEGPLLGRYRVSAWAEARCTELEQGRLDELLDALRSAASCEEARRCCEYIERNRDRMRYRDFRAAGLCIGSGVVEAGCKTVVGNRLKRAGMHWTVQGANAILALRCCMLSGPTRSSGNIQQWDSR